MSEIVEYFGENVLNTEKARELKNITNADLGIIIQIVSNKTGIINFFEDFSSWMRLSYKRDIQGISKWIDKTSAIGRKKQKLFLSYAIV